MKNLSLLLLLFLLGIRPGRLPGQTQQYQVVTKKIEKTFSYRPGYEVNIEGQKAEVSIETWDRSEVGVVLELIAKHPDRRRAEADLAAMRYQTDREKNRIYLRNYLSPAPDAPKPAAVFSVRYTIRLPADCPVYLKNHFGEALISNLAASLRVNSEFTRLGIDNVQGNVSVTTLFGDLEGSRLDGIVRINARRSNVTLREIKGRYDITAQYGILHIFADQNLLDLNINADKSEVYLHNPQLQRFAYDIQARNSELRLPNELEFKFLDNNPALKKATFKPQQEYYANITITISFGELVVRNR